MTVEHLCLNGNSFRLVQIFSGGFSLVRSRRMRSFALLMSTVMLSSICLSQAITVNITPMSATNHFVPSKSLGAGIDRISSNGLDRMLKQPTLGKVFSAGWQPVTYRQNTELSVEAWHWNPEGTWSQADHRGYFVSSADPTGFIRHSYGYKLPRRAEKLTDGNTSTYWKSNPYLSQRFTGEADSKHPQWVLVDLKQLQWIDSIRIAWAAPFATQYAVQFWTGINPTAAPTAGVWQTFPHGMVEAGKGQVETVPLADKPMLIRFVRILMTRSSNTCTADGPSDPRNCVGYAINELYLGTTTADGEFHDTVRHIEDSEQTGVHASSVDSWHSASDEHKSEGSQLGFDLFYKSGVTQGLPAIVPIAMIYDNPENAVAEIQYLEARHYPLSYIEMGEEADGQFISPEDDAALYLQFATALHKFDPHLKLGGPSFEGVNKDIVYWPDENGKASWLGRFLDYLKQHDRMQDLSFFSFEHYPYDPCRIPWGSLYDEPQLLTNIMQIWHEDGLPNNVPMLITESNLSSDASESFMDIFGGLWLADYIGTFLNEGGSGVYYFHYLPLQMENNCNNSLGTFGMFTVTPEYEIKQPLSQYFASRMINFEWLQHDGGMHTAFPSTGAYLDHAGHTFVTSYTVKRPDGDWSVMLVNRDQDNAHPIEVNFRNEETKTESYFSGRVHVATFGQEQYKWHPARVDQDAHMPMNVDEKSGFYTPGYADPDGPIAEKTVDADKTTSYVIPAASIVVLRGKLASQ